MCWWCCPRSWSSECHVCCLSVGSSGDHVCCLFCRAGCTCCNWLITTPQPTHSWSSAFANAWPCPIFTVRFCDVINYFWAVAKFAVFVCYILLRSITCVPVGVSNLCRILRVFTACVSAGVYNVYLQVSTTSWRTSMEMQHSSFTKKTTSPTLSKTN